MPNTCGNCKFFEELNENAGRCKIDPAKRNLCYRELNHSTTIVNGWPQVRKEELGCGQWKTIPLG